MRKVSRKVAALLCAAITLFETAACSAIPEQDKSREAAVFVTTFMSSVANNPREIKSEDINIMKRYNVLDDPQGDYSCQVLQYNMRYGKYTISDIEETNNGAIVKLDIEASKVGDTLSSDEFFSGYIAKKVSFEENIIDANEYGSNIVQAITDGIHETKKNKATSSATINVEKNDNGWHVISSNNLVNALSGDMDSSYYALASKYNRDSLNIENTPIVTGVPSSGEPDTTTVVTTLPAVETIVKETTTAHTGISIIATTTSTTTAAATTKPTTTTTTATTTKKVKTTTTTTTPPPPPNDINGVKYEVDATETFKDELIPNDTESKNLADSNKTTRTTRKKPIEIGDTAYYDNTDYFAAAERYAASIGIQEIYRGQAAQDMLDSYGEKYSLGKNQGLILIKVGITLEDNQTKNDKVKIPYYDFDVLNYNDKKADSVRLTKMQTFSEIGVGESTSGYICFKYTLKDNINLAFKEAADNTIWFRLIAKK